MGARRVNIIFLAPSRLGATKMVDTMNVIKKVVWLETNKDTLFNIVVEPMV